MQANRTLVHPGKGVRYCIGGCMSMGGITCVVTFISPLLVQPQQKPEKMKSHGNQISHGARIQQEDAGSTSKPVYLQLAKEKALPFVRNITCNFFTFIYTTARKGSNVRSWPERNFVAGKILDLWRANMWAN